MHAAKLLEVADMLDTLPSRMRPGDEFDMNQWCWNKECGTAACVLGWTAILLPHLGLEIRNSCPTFAVGSLTYFEYSAARRCFDIPYKDARRLFGHDNPDDPALMARTIRDYVAANTPKES